MKKYGMNEKKMFIDILCQSFSEKKKILLQPIFKLDAKSSFGLVIHILVTN